MRLAIWLLVELRPAATRNCQHAHISAGASPTTNIHAAAVLIMIALAIY
jgi:hypothetical protein